MGLKGVLTFLFVMLAIFLFLAYWLIPFGTKEFFSMSGNDNFNFSVDSSVNVTQFYDNLRYADSNISYRIDNDCPEFKKTSIENSFNTISNLTFLNFYPVVYGEEISAYCRDRSRPSGGGFFIAGEGGPINITKLGNFNLILHGEILLVKESKCKIPNIGIHEIFHALGFDHSMNPNSVMYNVSNCDQEIGEDLIKKVNELYSYPPYPDLLLENVSAVMNGKYLDTNITIKNDGFIKSKESSLSIYADSKKIKTIDISPIGAGYGLDIKLNNLFVPQINVNELKFSIDYSEPELEKINNEIKLKIKN